MRLFWQVMQLSFQRQINYRAATLAGLATNFFFGLLRAAVMVALYAGMNEVNGITLQDAISFTGFTQAIMTFIYLYGWFEVAKVVYSGEIGGALLKPMHYFTYWMAQDLGRALAQLLLRGLPLMALYAVWFRITLPQSVGQWFALGIALLLGWMLSFSLRYLVNLSAFWTTNAFNFGRFVFTWFYFLSGFLMPMRFFPEWFVRLCYLTPFPHVMNTTVEVYLGLLQGPALIQALLGQVLWIVAIVAVAEMAYWLGIRHLVVQGG